MKSPKFAPVCPIHILRHLDSLGPNYIGNYFLLLAHDVLQHKEEYESFFRGRNATVIMDNSVIELGVACDAETLMKAAAVVNATCVVMPDVLEEGEATVDRSKAFLKQWLAIPKVLRGDTQLMFVPQGSTLRDFEQCLHQAISGFGAYIDWIGIPRNVTGRIIQSRQYITGLVWGKAYSMMSNMPKIHLLGFSSDINDDIATAQHWAPYIEGIDSAVPLRLGSQGICLKDRASLVDPGPRGNWWEEVQIGTPSFVAYNTYATRLFLGELNT